MDSITDYLWLSVKDGDPRAFALMRNHYSFQAYADGRRNPSGNYRNKYLFVGPGRKLVLMTPACDALFVAQRNALFVGGVVDEELGRLIYGPQIGGEECLRLGAHS